MRPIVPQSILAWLCHYANANPSGCRDTFYTLKDRLLWRYAEFKGHDIQEITKQCWGRLDEYGDALGCKGKGCRRCGGTGVYDRFWVRLHRFQWGKYVFHSPAGQTRIQPESVQIHGRVKHADYGKASREAELWLYLVTLELGMWWKVLSTSYYASPGWWPMCRLQPWAMWARMTLDRKTCARCGKRFFPRGIGWHLCKKCRQPAILEQDNDIPF